MSLPTLDTPKYDLVVPSTGQKLKFRPFVVREQKIMLQAMEMGDKDQLNNAVEDIIKSCTFGEFDVDNSPVYDVEYVLLNIRAKSSGEVVDMFYRCNNIVEDNKCGSKIPVQIPLSDVQVVKPDGHSNKIMLANNVGLTMRDLPYGVYKTSTGKSVSEVGIEMISHCVENVFDAENVHSRKDFTQQELETFLEGLTNEQFDEIEKFMDTMPRLEMKLPMTCPSCGAQDTVTLSGLDDFLA